MREIKILFISLLTIVFSSCNDDDPCGDDVDCLGISSSPQDFIVVNEGNFGQANGTLSLINRETKSVRNDVVGNTNNGIATGDVVQSVYHDWVAGLIYVISNNESRILILNDSSFQQVGVIESDISLPRYMLIIDDKIYITNWNSDFTNAFVAVFDKTDLSFIRKIAMNPGAEQIYTLDTRKIFVSNNFTNTVQVFEYNGTSVTKTIKVGHTPNGITNVYNGFINVICQDTFGGNQGWVYEIDITSLTVSDSIPLNLKPGGQLLSDGSRVFFNSGKNIFAFDPRSEFDQSNNRILSFDAEVSSIYAFAIEPNSNTERIWIADPEGFTQNGMVHLVDITSSDKFVDSYEVGIGPNSFLFLNN
jgi:hypothetical protein